MRSIFLSYSFRNEHDPLLVTIRSIIEAVGFRIIDGKILDSNLVGVGVTDKLKKCYGAVCVLTTEAHQTGWVDAEFWQAVGSSAKVCLLCDDSLDLGNAYQGRAKMLFSKENLLQAIGTLAGTLGVWKQEAGTPARVLLLPTELSEEAISQNAECKYRCLSEIDAEESEWLDAKLVPYVAGVQAILPKVPANHSVKLKLILNHKILNSGYTPQQMTLQLK